MTYNIIAITLLLSTLSGCSAMGGVLSSALSPSDGIEATAQVGEENNKGTLALQSSNRVGVEEVQGDSKITTNSSGGMASMALIGMIPFVLLCFYLLPAPKWLQRRYNERGAHEET